MSFLRLSNGDITRSELIGSISHYNNAGVSITDMNGQQLIWIAETDNANSKLIIDELNNVIEAHEDRKKYKPDWSKLKNHPAGK